MTRSMMVMCVAASLGTPTRARAGAPEAHSSKSKVEPAGLAEGAVEAEDSAPRSMIDVHVGETIPRADALAEKIREDVVRVLRAHRVDLDAQAALRLAVGVGGESYAYRVNLVVMRDGAIVMPAPATWSCECTSEELLVKISQGVVDLVPLLAGEPVTSLDAEPSPPVVGHPLDENAIDRDERRPLGKLGKGGAAALGLGGGLAIAGAVLLGVGGTPDRGEQGLETTRNVHGFRPTGAAILGIGGAGIIVGAVLLGIDRKRARSSRVSARPMVGPRLTGFSLTTRF